MNEFFHQFKGEFTKIIWPNRETLTKQTLTVIATSLIVSAIVFGVDYVFNSLYSLISKIFG